MTPQDPSFDSYNKRKDTHMGNREEKRNLETIPVGSLGIITLEGCRPQIGRASCRERVYVSV